MLGHPPVIGSRRFWRPYKGSLSCKTGYQRRWHRRGHAIRTTDTTTKEIAGNGDRGKLRVGGMAKGSGMIHVNMGTMLASSQPMRLSTCHDKKR